MGNCRIKRRLGAATLVKAATPKYSSVRALITGSFPRTAPTTISTSADPATDQARKASGSMRTFADALARLVDKLSNVPAANRQRNVIIGTR